MGKLRPRGEGVGEYSGSEFLVGVLPGPSNPDPFFRPKIHVQCM